MLDAGERQEIASSAELRDQETRTRLTFSTRLAKSRLSLTTR